MKCKVKDCHNKCSDGDNLFCFEHRTSWRLYCVGLGINEKQISIRVTKKHLHKFKEGLI